MGTRDGHQGLLDYGRTDAVSVRALVTQLLPLVITVAVLAVAGPWVARFLYYYPESSVRSYLQTLSGTSAVRMNSYDDPPGLKVLFGIIDLPGSLGRSIELHLPHRGELRSGSHLRIHSFGPYSLHRMFPNGSECWSIDIGRDGTFANMLPFPVNSPQDLIDRYDEILHHLDKLGAVNEHTAPDGTTWRWRLGRKYSPSTGW